MTPDRWQTIVQMIESRFKILARYEEDLEPGVAEVIEFESPLGSLKARFVRRPRVLDKKTLYSRRAGGAVAVDYVYSDDEEVYHLELFKRSEHANGWTRMDASSLF